MKRFKFKIVGLDCAGCAQEVENKLNKNKDFSDVLVNFNNLTISFSSDKEFTIKELNNIVKKIESDAQIKEIDDIEKLNKKSYNIYELLIAIIICLFAYFINIPNYLKYILYAISYTLLLYKTFIKALKLLFINKTINENMLITISSLGALFIGDVLEGMMVIALYNTGKILEEKALNNSRRSIKSIIEIKENYANLKIKNGDKRINVEDIKIGDELVVKKGERIPVDGIIINGETILDTSSLTGESKPQYKKVDDEVLSGCINKGDVIVIRATTLFINSTVSKILELLQTAEDKKAKTETTISKLSRFYTPIIIILAILVLLILPLVFKLPFEESLYRALTFLVISCPCAIAISVPLSYFTGIGISSKNGILFKGSNYLDGISQAKKIVFDKTGTLTNGSFKVKDIVLDKKCKYKKSEIEEIIVKGECLSNHPIAKSLCKINDNVNNKDVKNFNEVVGKGITFTLNNDHIKIGNSLLCNCDFNSDNLHVSINDEHVADIITTDEVKDNAKKVIDELNKEKIETYMFTGDNKENAKLVGKSLNIKNIIYEMMPEDKYNYLEKISNDNEITIFVGDGINDTIALKRASIGISLGGVGSDAAIEASDVVIMNDDLEKIIKAISISKYTKKIIKENLIFALSTKIVILILSVLGLANMWFAVFADTGVTLLTILNTLRIIKRYR